MLTKKNISLMLLSLAIWQTSTTMNQQVPENINQIFDDETTLLTRELLEQKKGKKFEYAQFLLNNGANPNIGRVLFLNEVTALMYVSTFDDNGKTAQLCIEKGAKLNTTDGNGNTALHWACMFSKNQDTVKLLLEKGADAKIKNNDKKTPLALALSNAYHATVDVFLKHFKIEAELIHKICKHEFFQLAGFEFNNQKN